MKTYKITAKTNGYIANRDINFNGKTSKNMNEGLSLKDAQEKLLEYFNIDYEKFYSNWGLVKMNHKFSSSSFNDGTRSYEYDSRYYRIEEEE
jgi:hypothetical protein